MSFEVKTYHEDNEQLVETDLEKLFKSRGQNSRPEDLPHNYENFRNSTGPQNNRRGLGGRQNDFCNNRSSELQQGQEIVQPPRPAPPSSGRQSKVNPQIDPRIAAWQNLPAKLATEYNASAAAWEAQKLISNNLDDIPQPVYRDTFIEISAEDEGRPTGYLSTQILRDERVKTVAKEEKSQFEPASVGPAQDVKGVSTSAEASAPTTGAPVSTAQMDRACDDSFNESHDGGAALSVQISLRNEPAVASVPAVKSAMSPTIMAASEDPKDEGVEVMVHDSPVKRTADEISIAPTVEITKSKLRPQSADFIPAPRTAKIAVIINFALGTSQYATMALRELMKLGGVKTYKPDFSMGR